MTEQSAERAYHEYKVVVGVEFDSNAFHELETEWHPDRSRAVRTMETLREQGHLAEVHSREISATTRGEEVPE